MGIQKIISGGQAGADQGALDAALELGIPCGGWCPKGRRAENGVIPGCYPLSETLSKAYEVRTEWNVRDSDATLILNEGALEGGTALTMEVANRLHRPCLLLALETDQDLESVKAWLSQHEVKVLNIAGPRESKRPGIQHRAYRFLLRLLS